MPASSRAWSCVTAAILVAWSALGCRSETGPVEVLGISEGEIVALEVCRDDPNVVGRVHVQYRREKDDQLVTEVGEVIPQTEIMINGVLAGFRDLRVGERGRADVQVQHSPAGPRYEVLKMYIDRPYARAGAERRPETSTADTEP